MNEIYSGYIDGEYWIWEPKQLTQNKTIRMETFAEAKKRVIRTRMISKLNERVWNIVKRFYGGQPGSLFTYNYISNHTNQALRFGLSVDEKELEAIVLSDLKFIFDDALPRIDGTTLGERCAKAFRRD